MCAELGEFLLEELHWLDRDKIRYFSDSGIVLHWLMPNPSILTPFVANRVAKIQKRGCKFQYINTHENPADIASRGCTVEHLKSRLWLHGPEFLQLEESNWPAQKTDFSKVDPMLEVKRQHVFVCTLLQVCVNTRNEAVNFLDYFSKYEDLLRVTTKVHTCVWRILEECKGYLPLPRPVIPTRADRLRAKFVWYKDAQQQYFADKIKLLKEGKEIRAPSKLMELDPFLDNEGVLPHGGGGRVQR